MELIIQLLMLFVVLNCILKLSFWKRWQAVVFGILCGAFVVGSYQYAILQSKTQLADFLNNTTVMQDAAVLITVESSICFAFCFMAIRDLFGKKVSRWSQVLHWYVSLLIFPVLFYLLTQLIFQLSGTDFSTIAWGLAVAVAVGIPILSYVVSYLLPEKDLRLELHFLISLFVCVLGLITTVNGNVTYAATEETVNLKALFWSFGLFAVTFLIGFVWSKKKWIILQKKRTRQASKINHKQNHL